MRGENPRYVRCWLEADIQPVTPRSPLSARKLTLAPRRLDTRSSASGFRDKANAERDAGLCLFLTRRRLRSRKFAEHTYHADVRVYPRAEAGETVTDINEFWLDDETCEKAAIHRLLKLSDGAR